MSESNLIYHLDPPPWSNPSIKRGLTHMRCPFAERVRARIPYIDYDYINELSDKDKKFMENFTREYYGADFRKAKIRHKKKYKRDCEHRNNQINRCIHARTQLFGLLYYLTLNELDRLLYNKQVNLYVDNTVLFVTL